MFLFGTDIDDSINDIRYTFLKVINREYGLSITPEQLDENKEFFIENSLPELFKPKERVWYRHIDELFETNKPLPHSADALWEMERNGIPVFYCTARPSEYRDLTLWWLKKHGFPIQPKRLFIGMEDLEKADILKEHGIDVFVDDRDHIIHSVREVGIRGIIKDQCYNQNVSGERLVHWKDIHQFVMKNKEMLG